MATSSAAIFVPKEAPITVSLLISPDRLEAFRQVVAQPVTRRQTRIELKQIEKTLLAAIDADLDYRRDIQPWLGDEITLAVTSLDFDHNRDNAAQPGYLLVLTTKDPEKTREFLQLYYSEQTIAGSEDLVFEQYKGVNLIYKRPPTKFGKYLASSELDERGKTLTVAMVGDRFVLFANHPKVLKDAINNVQVADLNLANDPTYQQTLQSLTEPRIGLSFVNLPALGAWIANQPAEREDNLLSSQTLALSFSLKRQGLLAQTAIAGLQTNSESTQPTLSGPVKALQYIPAESSLAIAGTDLNQFWHRLSASLAKEKTLKFLLDQSLASLESDLDIQLPEEVFSWVQGEYALSLLPGAEPANLGWVFVAERTLGDESETAIKHLDEVAKGQGLSVGSLSLEQQPITAWTKLSTSTTFPSKKKRAVSLEAKVQGVHATVGNYEIFGSSIEAIDKALAGKANSLLETDQFRGAIASLPEPNDGYFYLDWTSSESFIQQQLPIVRVAQLLLKPLFNHLDSLSISSYGIENGIQRSQLFIGLDKSNQA